MGTTNDACNCNFIPLRLMYDSRIICEVSKTVLLILENFSHMIQNFPKYRARGMITQLQPIIQHISGIYHNLALCSVLLKLQVLRCRDTIIEERA